eukprot:3876404-Heterocapsa_arctica.AAC.1
MCALLARAIQGQLAPLDARDNRTTVTYDALEITRQPSLTMHCFIMLTMLLKCQDAFPYK